MNKNGFRYKMAIGFLFFTALILNPPLLSAIPIIIDHTSIDAFYSISDNAINNIQDNIRWYDAHTTCASCEKKGNAGRLMIEPLIDGLDQLIIYTIENGEVEFNDSSSGGPTDYGTRLSRVPEPATMLLLGAGLAGLGVFRKKFRKA